VLSLELIDPRFYHLDTALTVLTDDPEPLLAYYPPAFSDGALALLRKHFPDAIVCGHRRRLRARPQRRLGRPARGAARRRDRVRRTTAHRRLRTDRVDLSELLKGGGSVKCCTLEVFS
jgi:N-dimethylarginine dimethylaminohydrolase